MVFTDVQHLVDGSVNAVFVVVNLDLPPSPPLLLTEVRKYAHILSLTYPLPTFHPAEHH